MGAFTEPLFLSLRVAGLGTLFGFLLAVPLAFRLTKRRLPLAGLWDSLCTLPMVLPPTVLGYCLLVLLGRNGPAGRWLYEHFGIRVVFTLTGAVIAATLAAFPLVFRSARAAFEGVDRSAEEAARDLGAPPLRVFLDVSLPLARRGLLAGGMLAFARAMGEFGATMMIAGNLPGKTQTLALAIYSAAQAGKEALALELAVFTSVVCVSLLWGAGRLFEKRDHIS